MAAEKVKARKGFEYKMSKKVAELTQVVHMLFTRNHEREVEIQMTKDLYRKEVQRIHKSYQQKIGKLEEKLKLIEEKSKAEQGSGAVQTKIENALHEQEARWIKKIDSKENELISERNTNAALREKLTKYEAEVFSLRLTSDDSSNEFSSKLAGKQQEVEKLEKRVNHLDNKLVEEKQRAAGTIKSLEQMLAEKKEEADSLSARLTESQGNESSLARKLNTAESVMKTLKREMAKKAATDLSSARRSSSIHTPPDQGFAPQEVYEELDHLKKLVQKYRLELSNREGNFNRMFTEKNPVHVDHRSIKTLAPLPPKATNGDKSMLNHSSDINVEPERRLSHSRADSALSRRSMTLTGIRRSNMAGGRQLLAQYNQQHNFKT